MAALVSAAGETVSTYPALDAIFPVDCSTATGHTQTCPNDFQITDAITELLASETHVYTLDQIEAAAKALAFNEMTKSWTGIFQLYTF